MTTITYKSDLTGVDWRQMKETLLDDDFDNGRTPEQLQTSFHNSFVASIAYDGDRIIGTARALSDGVCNAYVVDVWTHSAYRRQGIGRHMMELLLEQLPGQHVYLFSDDRGDFYKALDFEERGQGYERVVGRWLVNEPA